LQFTKKNKQSKTKSHMIKILFIGKTNEQFISAGIDKFLRRINHFYPTKILFLLPVGHTEYLKM